MADAYLALESGAVVAGRARASGTVHGELVFTTAYTGYEESLTDPSYAEQVLTFAYPLIGNYGVRSERFESERVQPSAVLARELTDEVADWLAGAGVPAIDALDTRDLVLEIRDRGAMRCGLSVGDDASEGAAREQLDRCPPMSEHVEIGAQVSVAEPVAYPGDGPSVALIDCGAKASIVDALRRRDAAVTVLPYDTAVETIEELAPDVLFFSNGPGDPTNFLAAERLVEAFAGAVPIAGICLGQQIVANALGGSTEKMSFGHRGVNQPVRDLATDRVVITTQNHGYTVADPGPLAVTQVNVNDGTPEGLESDTLSILTRQYHPEAHPGPHDSLDFFDEVLALAESAAPTAVAD